ncbi:hypothetical protein [Streptomyces sp. NEAU-H3]|uniref:hypothetical protein n=1 Tax=Streptomyces sp. NEAU-H3 TaxID=2720636 RepID=UPI00143C1624|nr:hypothetical protein [Streptomyces sp. NEAU-H3]NJA56692.1 hypothetical protein [Streptomyces sp. NEAU-H3]
MPETNTPEPLTPERLREICDVQPGDWYAGPWTQRLVEPAGDEPGRCEVVHEESGTVLAVLPDWAAGIALFIADAHDAVPELAVKAGQLRAELTARPSRAEVLREAEGVVRAHAERVDDAAQRRSWRDAANVLGLRADVAEADAPTPAPLVVSRFDVAIEPAPEEDPVLTIGCIAEDGRPVALLLDPEAREKVAGWLAPSRAEVLREVADDWITHCPEHSDAEEAWMDCPCDWAEELQHRANQTEKRMQATVGEAP